MTATASSDRARLLERRRRSRSAFDHGRPLQRVDTLPILLFLLCLVATFLAVYARPPHALLIGLPQHIQDGVAVVPDRSMPLLRIGMDAEGVPLVNGMRRSLQDVERILQQARALPREPGVIFEPDARSRYGDVLPLLGATRKAGMADWKFCFGALDRHRHFDKDPGFKPLRLSLLPPVPMPAGAVPPGSGERCDPRRQRPRTVPS